MEWVLGIGVGVPIGILAAWAIRERQDPREVRRKRALRLGYFWLPCPSCGVEFGGNEGAPDRNHLRSIPSGPPDDISEGRSICPACQVAGVGDREWAEKYERLGTPAWMRLTPEAKR